MVKVDRDQTEGEGEGEGEDEEQERGICVVLELGPRTGAWMASNDGLMVTTADSGRGTSGSRPCSSGIGPGLVVTCGVIAMVGSVAVCTVFYLRRRS